MLLNGHNLNLPQVEAIIQELLDTMEKENIQRVSRTYFFMGKEESDKIRRSMLEGTHANGMKTPITLALFPFSVKMDEEQKGIVNYRNYRMRRVINFDEGAMFVNHQPNSKVFSWVYGHLDIGMAEKGKAQLETLVNKVSQIIMDLDKGRFNPSLSNGTAQNF